MTPPTTPESRAERFRSLHVPGSPLLMPNAWDVGSAALFASLGFEALATTSGGFAATRGRLDGAMTKDEVLAHAGELAQAVDVPVSADLENCFAHEPDGVAATIAAAAARGLAGGSVEDFTGDPDDPIYELAQAAERVQAAAEAAHGGPHDFVLTARAENYLHGRADLDDTIARLHAYQEAGADVLFGHVSSTRSSWAGCCPPSTCRSASSSCRAPPPSASWPSSGSAGSRWAAPSPSPRTAPPSRP